MIDYEDILLQVRVLQFIVELRQENDLLRQRLSQETARALHAEAILSSVKENIINFETKYDEVL